MEKRGLAAKPTRAVNVRRTVLIGGSILAVIAGAVAGIMWTTHSPTTPSATRSEHCVTGPLALLQKGQVPGFYAWTTGLHTRPVWDGAPSLPGVKASPPDYVTGWLDGSTEGLLANATTSSSYMTWQSNEERRLGLSTKQPLVPLRGPIVSNNPDSPLEIWEKTYTFTSPVAAEAWVKVSRSVGYSPISESYPSYSSDLAGSVTFHEQDLPKTPDGYAVGRFYDAAVVVDRYSVLTVEVHGGTDLSVSAAGAIFDLSLSRIEATCPR